MDDGSPDPTRIDHELLTLNTLIKQIAEKGIVGYEASETARNLGILKQIVAYLEAVLNRLNHEPN